MQFNKTYYKIATLFKWSLFAFMISLGFVAYFQNPTTLIIFTTTAAFSATLFMTLLMKPHHINGQIKYSYQLLWLNIKKTIQLKTVHPKIDFLFNPKKMTTITLWVGISDVISYLIMPSIYHMMVALTSLSLIYLVGLITYYTVSIVLKGIDLRFLTHDVNEI